MTTPADNGNPSPETSDEVTQSEAYKALEAQYKGLQRKLDKAQKTAARSIASEEQQTYMNLLNEKLDLVLSTLEDEDEDRSEKFSKFRDREKALRDATKKETQFLSEITTLEIENDVDFNDFPVAAAHWENGNFEKALAEFKANVSSTPEPEPESEPRVKPDAGTSTVNRDTPSRRSDLTAQYDEALAKGDIRGASRIVTELRKLES